MSKNIKDYIYYYIGQKVSYGGKLLTIVGYDAMQDKVVTSDGNWGFKDLFVTEIHLALRKLEDMTEEEVLHLFDLAYCGFVPYGPVIVYDGMGCQHGTTVIHETVRCIQIDTYSCHPSVGGCLPFALLQLDDELIWGKFSDAGSILQDDVTSRQFEQFHYLLSKGFDIWGLIDAGLAIDAKTITQ